jgi:adenosylhomocysteine nucleosidase/5'-methylthioadenosine nucleosidase
VRTIGLVMAMRAEAQPVLDALGAKPVASPPGAEQLPQRWYVAQRSGVEIVIAVNGVDPHFGVDSIATQPAVLTTFTTCRHWPIDLLESAGAAGGWARCGAAVGDVYVSRDRFVYHDRRIDLPGFREYGLGEFPAVDASRLAHELGLEQGIVTTSNSLDENEDDRRLIAASGACVKDMEAAAVADVGRLLGVPVMAVKSITDLVDSHVATGEQFLANLELAIARLRDALVRVVDWCADREVIDLGGFMA